MSNDQTNFILKNIGFEENFFQKITPSSSYIIRNEIFKKNYSDGAIVKIPTDIIFPSKSKEEEDKELYAEVEDEYNPFVHSGEDLIDNYIKEKEVESEREREKENDLSIFKNCAQDQLLHLKEIFQTMNESKEEKIIVKAYKSKLKSKFYKIYQHNSQVLKEKVKYKMFHKCNFPGCKRTFASSGWLRSHFFEHMKEIKKNKFNLQFDYFIETLKNRCNILN